MQRNYAKFIVRLSLVFQTQYQIDRHLSFSSISLIETSEYESNPLLDSHHK